MALYQRLKDLREDADKTQSEVATYLGTTAQYYGRYEKGESELPLSRAIQLAEYYDVSLDYIAGRSAFAHSVSLTGDEEQLLKSWRSLSERSKGKIEYHIEELLRTQDQRKNK
ncbi:MAG: helix-turn-helix domain-containing protein [Ruminococcaceae bacterium]|nr:helix-turn-helix domain-containing protein [Oscillospiraceae bacterium]